MTDGYGFRGGRLPALIAAAALAALLGHVAPARSDEPAVAQRFMVVAANPHAARAGYEILEAGGSAVDAAIAVQAVLSLVEPQSSGIGGGAFMLYLDAPDEPGETAEIVAYEGRETAPAAATPDMFLDENGNPMGFAESAFGGLAVGVPGVMRMLELAHREHGRLPWAALFAPAIRLAEEGFEISPRLYFLLDQFKRFETAPEFRAHYYDENGEPHPTGYRLVNPEYAATLRAIAEQGADAMYIGSLAEAIVRAVRDNPLRAGRLTLEDLERYEAHRGGPLCTPYRERRVCGPRPPSSGGVTVQQILGILAHFDVAATADDPPKTIHLVAEAARLAFADRAQYLGDPDFVDVPVEALLDPKYLERRASLIDPERAMRRVEAGIPSPAAARRYAPSLPQTMVSTSHFSIVDAQGDAVTMTTSVQSTFGSTLMVGGFLLNNQLTDFSYEPERFGRPVANRVEPGKRPLSSMAPTFVLDREGRLEIAIGSPGGTRIINYVSQALVNIVDLGMNVQDAISAPHFVAQHGPIELEQGTPVVEHAAALEALGHRVVPRTLNSGLHAIVVEHGEAGRKLYGGADPRREGVALGD
ncbi:MAG: gamma-glutamyltransferase [Gammaproteobacteria bacterium]